MDKKMALKPWVLSGLALCLGFMMGTCYTQSSVPEQAAPPAPANVEPLDPDNIEPFRALARAMDALYAQKQHTQAPVQAEAGGEQRPDWRSLSGAVQSLCTMVRDGNLNGAESQIRMQLGRTDQPEVQAFWTELRMLVRKLMSQREAALRERSARLWEEARKAALAAERPAELLPALEAISGCLALRDRSWDESVREEWDRLNQAANFLRQMRSYLAAREEGNGDGASQTLSSLRGNPESRLLTHAELMKKTGSDENGDWVAPLLRAANLEDLPALIVTLAKQAPLNPGIASNYASNLIYALNALTAAHSSIRSGRPNLGLGFLQNTYYYRGLWAAEIERLAHQVERAWIAAVTDLSAADLPATVAPTKALEERADEASARKEWERALVLLSALAELRPGKAEGALTRLQACQAYLAGQRLEAAGELEEAAKSYREVLRLTGPQLPYEEASAALKRLAKPGPGDPAKP